jgi:hypothetical protein
VPVSFKWYQSLLGLPVTAPAHDYFGQILDSDGTVLPCLHEWGAHVHPSDGSNLRSARSLPPNKSFDSCMLIVRGSMALYALLEVSLR